jgi:hypothetical protein
LVSDFVARGSKPDYRASWKVEIGVFQKNIENPNFIGRRVFIPQVLQKCDIHPLCFTRCKLIP